MNTLVMIGIDIAAIAILTLALYYRRHHRRDLVTAFVVVNVGVLAVTSVLAGADVGMGVGLGLFGVLSIIRLRSSEISQTEVAYYFASLAIGLIAGFASLTAPVAAGLIALILGAIAVVDSRLVFGRTRQQTIRLDRAYTDEAALRGVLEQTFGGRILSLAVVQCDLVNDSTVVDVRWQQPGRAAGAYPPRFHDANAEVTSAPDTRARGLFGSVRRETPATHAAEARGAE